MDRVSDDPKQTPIAAIRRKHDTVRCPRCGGVGRVTIGNATTAWEWCPKCQGRGWLWTV